MWSAKRNSCDGLGFDMFASAREMEGIRERDKDLAADGGEIVEEAV